MVILLYGQRKRKEKLLLVKWIMLVEIVEKDSIDKNLIEFQIDGDMQRALTIEIDQNFPEIAVPKGGDWLTIYNESGQTAEQFEKCKKVRPSSTLVYLFKKKPSRYSLVCVYRRNIIFIQPIGKYDTPR